MNDILGVLIFYVLLLLGVAVLVAGILTVDLTLFAISFFLVIGAFLVKFEFKVPVLFWKNTE
jgi:hypothetical protein